MKILFRKHGNSLFYILLPVLFLALTVAFIQFTPRVSQTAPGDACVGDDEAGDDQCCTTSGCGIEISEICEDDTCKRINVGCPDGGTVNDTPNGCVCVDEEGEVISECLVCDLGELFVDGVCERICLEGEDPEEDNCVPVGAFVEGSGIGCSLSSAANAASSLPSMLMGLGLLGAAFAVRKRS